MKPEPTPQQKPFWTKDMVALALLNIILIGIILVMLFLIFSGLASPFKGWLEGILAL